MWHFRKHTVKETDIITTTCKVHADFVRAQQFRQARIEAENILILIAVAYLITHIH